MEYALGVAGIIMVIVGTVACFADYTGDPCPPRLRRKLLVMACGYVLLVVALVS